MVILDGDPDDLGIGRTGAVGERSARGVPEVRCHVDRLLRTGHQGLLHDLLGDLGSALHRFNGLKRERQRSDPRGRELALTAQARNDALRRRGWIGKGELGAVFGSRVPRIQIHRPRRDPMPVLAEQGQAGNTHKPVWARRDHRGQRDAGIVRGESDIKRYGGDGTHVARAVQYFRPGRFDLVAQDVRQPQFRHVFDTQAGAFTALQEDHLVAVDAADHGREVGGVREPARRALQIPCALENHLVASQRTGRDFWIRRRRRQ